MHSSWWRWQVVLPAILILALLAACGGGDDDDDGEDATPASTTSAPAATATTVPAATQSTSPTVPATATVSGTPQLDPETEALLEDVALTLADMPADWVEIPGDTSEQDDNGGPCGAETFPERDTRLGDHEVQFGAGELGPFVFQDLVIFPTDIVDDAFAYARETTQCTEWTEDQPGGQKDTYRLEQLDFPDVGDESFAVRVSIEIPEAGTLVNDSVFVRVGEVLTIVIYSALEETDLTELQRVVEAAVERIREGTE